MVDEHEWTYDAIETYSKAIFQDLDNDGKAGRDDIVGLADTGWAMINYLSSSNGISFITQDEEGFPRLNLYTEESIRWVNLLYHLCHDDNIANPYDVCNFNGGKNLFEFGLLSDLSGSKRDIELAHGVLPYPLIDSGNEYVTCAGAVNGSSIVVPITTPDSRDELCGAAMEALCFEAYRTVLPAWLETALKSKYSDTRRDADMIDIIYHSIDNSLLLMSDKQMNGATGSFFMNFLGREGKKPDEFTSYCTSKTKMLDKQWDGMIEKYQKLGE